MNVGARSNLQLIPSKVVSDPSLVDMILGQRDLNRTVLWDGLLTARDFLSSLSPNNPSYSYPHGTGSFVRVLRDHLVKDFRRELRHGLSVTTHRSGDFTILVVRGTPNTGDPDPSASPGSHRPRRIATYRVFQDQSQLPLLSVGEPSPRLEVLLFHIDKKTNQATLELSVPRNMVQAGNYWYFGSWEQRIVIPPPPMLPSSSVLHKPVAPNKPGWTPTVGPGDLDLKRKAI